MIGPMTALSSVEPYLGPKPTWTCSAEDSLRVAAYEQYDSMYRNEESAFAFVRLGDDALPISLPNAKVLVEATNRYLAKRWTYAIEPGMGTDADRAELDARLRDLFLREQMWAKFNTQKRWGLVRGDAVWLVLADPGKPEGRRISIREVNPAFYFPITDPWDDTKVIGAHLAEPFTLTDGSGTVVVRRQTYRKALDGRISYSLGWFEPGAWDDRVEGLTLKTVDPPEGDGNEPVDEMVLPDTITSLPVYHVKNDRTPDEPFGSSEIAGYEGLIRAVNQSMSDEDMALALEGLGLYFTNSGPPVDDDGNETTWRLGPGYVVEGDSESDFKRVTGISNVDPIQTHIAKIESAMREANGIPDIAVGSVDAAVAESGIALALKMAPLLSKNEEKEVEILSKIDHILYDLVTGWFPAYEGFSSPARAVSIVSDPLPQNRKQVMEEVTALLSTTPPLISAEYARTLLSERLGYDFPDEMSNTVVTEAADYAAARNADPFATRVVEELEARP